MRGDRAALAQFADSLVGRGLKADLRDGEARGVGEGGLHLGEARLDARALRDEGQIDVGGLQAAGPQFRTDPLQQQLGVDPAIGGVGVRKKVPDVRQAGGTPELYPRIMTERFQKSFEKARNDYFTSNMDPPS